MPQANTKFLRRRRIKKNEPFNFPAVASTLTQAELGGVHDFKGTYTDLELCVNHVASASFAGKFWLPFTRSYTTDISGDFTLALADIGLMYRNLATARVVTIPYSTSVDFPIGTAFAFFRQGAGNIDIKGATNVVLTGYIKNVGPLANNWARISVDGGQAMIIKLNTNPDQWMIVGRFTQGS